MFLEPTPSGLCKPPNPSFSPCSSANPSLSLAPSVAGRSLALGASLRRWLASLSLSLALAVARCGSAANTHICFIRARICTTVLRRKMLENEANPVISKTTRLPRKRFYRARAHSNPLSDSHFPVPISPCHVEYSQHFPELFSSDQVGHSRKIQFADIGCGFGGLLINLATLFPDKLMIGMELRDKVMEYVKERILALRGVNPGQYRNISVVRTNSMKYIPNYFEKGQLSKMFFLFPDPHFKEKNHRRRVISPHLLDEYAYVLGVGGIIYTITDVEELGDWMKTCLERHPMFEPLSHEELEADPVVKLLSTATEEGQKVARNGGQTFQAVYRRIVPAS